MRWRWHLPLAAATIIAHLGAAYRNLTAALAGLPFGEHPEPFTHEQAAAADRALRYLTAAADTFQSTLAAQPSRQRSTATKDRRR